ncbi:cyclic nucleotide-binding protein [Undibacterium sp. YM2]|uniref:Crp/Fnr family transcriptional regulator n=1 Tax=Undibacterium sp. YM2 TaxID=2058625 RepID=UPI001331CA5D|nr:cyclic nucleotide-binding domain-containing protein [Undibacterium sp. YM2]BBB68340.1 cyclic nucleotide-binding protein [Undibacterium sp. YM2]
MNPDQALPGFRLVGAGTTFQSRDICDMVSESQLFADLEWKDIEALAAYLQCYEVSAGTTIFREGEAGSYMGLLVKGEVGILKTDLDGTPHRIVSVGHGKTIGEMSIIDGEKRSATCLASQTSILLLLTKDNYQRIIREKPALAVQILARLAKLMSQRLRSVSGQLVEFL